MSRLDRVGPYDGDLSAARQRAALLNGRVPVAVYGLGKMGLPLAAVYADVTGNVTGVDVDPTVVDAVERGDCHVQNEPGLPALVADVVERDALRATGDAERAAADAAVHVVIVPTPVTDGDEPDLSNLTDVAESVATGLDPGDLVVVESTVPPHTCREVVRPLLAEESGLSPDEFGVAFCPERTASGRSLRDIRHAHPKVVGGVDAESARAAELVYGELTDNDVLTVSDAATAEAVKVFEGVYRDVDIAIANQFAQFADELGVDVNEAAEVANTQPYCDILAPGPGVGGHCIPYYPYFLTEPFETDAPLIRTAREVNDAMPGFTVAKLAELLDETGTTLDEATVLVLGLTYRAGVEETSASPGVAVVELLDRHGATVLAADPMLDGVDAPAEWVTSAALDERDVDGVVLATAHEEYRDLDWDRYDPMVVVDGRQAVDAEGTDHRVYTIGGG